MRPFSPVIGKPVDLDNVQTYQHLPQDVEAVRRRLFEQIGYARLYVLIHDFAAIDTGDLQIARIDGLVAAIAKGWREPRPLAWWQERLFVFQDEIENMC